MTIRVTLALLVALGLASLVHGAETTTPSAEIGVVKSVSEGVLYISGIPHSIATVETGAGTKQVAVPAMSSMQPLQMGESLSFSGTSITVNSESIINTQSGFVFRASEKSMAAYMTDMMSQAQVQAQEAAKSGIPTAVPTMMMETAGQKAEKAEAEEVAARERRTDLLLTLLSFIIAVLAFERIQRFLSTSTNWIRSLSSRKSRPTRAKDRAQQEHGEGRS